MQQVPAHYSSDGYWESHVCYQEKVLKTTAWKQTHCRYKWALGLKEWRIIFFFYLFSYFYRLALCCSTSDTKITFGFCFTLRECKGPCISLHRYFWPSSPPAMPAKLRRLSLRKQFYFFLVLIMEAVSISAHTPTTVLHLSTRWRCCLIFVRVRSKQMSRFYILFISAVPRK